MRVIGIGLVLVGVMVGETMISDSPLLDLFPHIARAGNNYIVEWEAETSSGSFEIFVRAIDGNGNVISSPLQVSSDDQGGHRLNGTIISSEWRSYCELDQS